MPSQEEIRRIDLLTEEQRDVLRRYLRRQETKEIARDLGITPSAVEQRFQRARAKLGAGRTIDAARMLADHEAACGIPTWGPSALPDRTEVERNLSPHTGGPLVPTEPAALTDEYDASAVSAGRLFGDDWWPFPTRGRTKNDLTTTIRLAWMILGLVALIGVIAMLMNAVVALDVLLKSHL